VKKLILEILFKLNGDIDTQVSHLINPLARSLIK